MTIEVVVNDNKRKIVFFDVAMCAMPLPVSFSFRTDLSTVIDHSQFI
jgi:hypothetical protein